MGAGVVAIALALPWAEAADQCGNLLKSINFEGCVLWWYFGPGGFMDACATCCSNCESSMHISPQAIGSTLGHRCLRTCRIIPVQNNKKESATGEHPSDSSMNPSDSSIIHGRTCRDST